VVLDVGRAGTVRAAGAPTDTWQWYGVAHRESYHHVLPCREVSEPRKRRLLLPN
jgi:hypothetical protein